MELSSHLHITEKGTLVWISIVSKEMHEVTGIDTILHGSVLLFKLKN